MRSGFFLTTALALSLAVPGIAAAQSSQSQPQSGGKNATQASSGQSGQPSAQAMQSLHQARQSLQQALPQASQPGNSGQQARESINQALNDVEKALDQIQPNQQNRASYDRVGTSIERARQAMEDSTNQWTPETTGAVREVDTALNAFTVGNGSSGQSASASDRNRSQDSAQGAQISVDQARPQVAVQQPAPDVNVRQPAPQVTVQQPRPEVTIQQPKPEVTVNQPRPEVNVTQAEPQVQVERQGEPQVNVQQQGQPDVTVTRPDNQQQDRTRSQSTAQSTSQQETSGQSGAAQTASAPIQGMPPTMTAEEVIGRDVYSAAGDDIGEVEDLLIDPQSGQVQQAVISVGGFLGIGDRDVAVNLDRLSFDGQRDAVVVDTTRDQLEQMPVFEYSDGVTSLRNR